MSRSVEDILAGLTEPEQRVVRYLCDLWAPGPAMPETEPLAALREIGLVERQFGDQGDWVTTIREDEISFRLTACWFFRLTPLGLSVRKHLEETHGR